MKNSDFIYKLANRTRIGISIDNELLKAFDEFATESRINKSRLYDEAISDLLVKYGKPLPKKLDAELKD